MGPRTNDTIDKTQRKKSKTKQNETRLDFTKFKYAKVIKILTWVNQSTQGTQKLPKTHSFVD